MGGVIMFNNVVFTNAHFDLIEEDVRYYVRFRKKDYPMSEFNTTLGSFPQFLLTDFSALRTAMVHASGTVIHIGEKRPRIEISISKDRMKASVRLNYSDDEVAKLDPPVLAKDIIRQLEASHVIFGYDLQSISQNLQFRTEYTVATGTLPDKGSDASIRYYNVSEPQPKLFEDGKVNHYELQLINNVEKGDWVGERDDATPGETGKTVYGEVLPGQSGRQLDLSYDPNTVEEVYVDKDKKTYLYSKRKGAVVFEDGKISVCNYLEIDGKVSFKTGNIDFDGFVGVTDTIEDNFSITAEKDIQVMGDIGVGAVNTIESTEGNIYIRGGIAGKNKARIVCNGNLYTKFAADCTIECEGTVNIGYYAMNCQIKAKEVIMESSKSKIIGGRTEADIKVVTGEIGGRGEIFTQVVINGFKRDELKSKYDAINDAIQKYEQKLTAIKQKLNIYDSSTTISDKEKENLKQLTELESTLKDNLKLLLDNQKHYKSYLQTKGEGEIRVTSKIYPNVKLAFSDSEMHSHGSNLPVTYYLSGNTIKEL